ncbi:exported hypothetical protein [Desulfamplus magnetovallimortis]|uniref:LamG-like jellyroll fold domain-containing protein n=2 Tax=Desulfamplus magnetovallimortis TaxID=1246637 RepID=A0A1W1H8H0_9BACT|nr:exported hypothetical protein [Desulfamplus magnetovallimortis]
MKRYIVLSVLAVVFFWGFVGMVQAGLSDGLVGYYPFNGNADDESGSGNYGVADGVTLVKDRHENNGRAYSFDGNDKIAINSPITTSITYSVSLWMRYSSVLSSNQILLANGGDTNGSQGLAIFIVGTGLSYPVENIDYGRSVAFSFAEETLDIRGSVFAPISPDDWHHIVAIRDPYSSDHKAVIYINGVKYADSISTIDSGNRFGEINNMMFGTSSASPGAVSLNGELDDIRVYDRILSESEINQLYHEGEACEDNYDEGYEAGKQYCIDNPEACGISTNGGFTQADLDAKYAEGKDDGYDEGYRTGIDSCDNPIIVPDSNCATFDLFTNTLSVPCLNMGKTYWVDMKLEGDHLTIDGFGEVE